LALPIHIVNINKTLRARKAWRTDVRSINEAEQVEKGDGGNHIEINLPAKFSLGFGIKMDQRMTIPKCNG